MLDIMQIYKIVHGNVKSDVTLVNDRARGQTSMC